MEDLQDLHDWLDAYDLLAEEQDRKAKAKQKNRA